MVVVFWGVSGKVLDCEDFRRYCHACACQSVLDRTSDRYTELYDDHKYHCELNHTWELEHMQWCVCAGLQEHAYMNKKLLIVSQTLHNVTFFNKGETYLHKTKELSIAGEHWHMTCSSPAQPHSYTLSMCMVSGKRCTIVAWHLLGWDSSLPIAIKNLLSNVN